MLIEFSVSNYRSFRDRVTLSMLAADIASQPPSLDQQNVFAANDELRLLSAAVIYGANAAGKSNLILALRFMRDFVFGSSREMQAGQAIPVELHRLHAVTAEHPAEFELVCLIDGVQYRYGFRVTAERVVAEWLYRLGTRREMTLFTRDYDAINVNRRNFREGRDLPHLTRPNALFLSVVAQFNGAQATALLGWFIRLGINVGITDQMAQSEAVQHFQQPLYHDAITELIRRFDVGIEAVQVERVNGPLPDAVRRVVEVLGGDEYTVQPLNITTRHRRYAADGQPLDAVEFDFLQHESAGTQRLFALAYPIIRALREGLVLAIDELDARLHPNLVIELIRLFQEPHTNPHHAQLLFTTHNSGLLSARLLRRDQIWLVEKSRQGASALTSLVEYRIDGRMIRNDASFEKEYLAGRFGAVPFVGDLGEVLEQVHGAEVTS